MLRWCSGTRPVAEHVPQVVGTMSAEGRWVAATTMMPAARPRATRSRSRRDELFVLFVVPTVARSRRARR